MYVYSRDNIYVLWFAALFSKTLVSHTLSNILDPRLSSLMVALQMRSSGKRGFRGGVAAIAAKIDLKIISFFLLTVNQWEAEQQLFPLKSPQVVRTIVNTACKLNIYKAVTHENAFFK